MKHFLLWRRLMFQTKFSYLTHNHGRGGQQVLEISAPTGGASGYLQAHLASAGRVGRGRRAGGGGSVGRLRPYFRSEHALGVAIGGVQTPPPSPQMSQQQLAQYLGSVLSQKFTKITSVWVILDNFSKKKGQIYPYFVLLVTKLKKIVPVSLQQFALQVTSCFVQNITQIKHHLGNF